MLVLAVLIGPAHTPLQAVTLRHTPAAVPISVTAPDLCIRLAMSARARPLQNIYHSLITYFREAGLCAEIVRVPSNRDADYMKAGTVNATLRIAAFDGRMGEDSVMIRQPVLEVPVFLVTASNTVTSLADTHGQYVAYPRGYLYADLLMRGHDHVLAAGAETLVDLYNRGRVPHFILDEINLNNSTIERPYFKHAVSVHRIHLFVTRALYPLIADLEQHAAAFQAGGTSTAEHR